MYIYAYIYNIYAIIINNNIYNNNQFFIHLYKFFSKYSY